MAARHARLPHRRRRLDGPGARRRRRGRRPARRHPGHLDRRQGARRRRAPARRHHQARPGDPRRRDGPQLRRRLGGCRGDGGRHRPGRRDGQPADVRPLGLGGRGQQEAAERAVLRTGRQPAARPGDAGPVRARLDLEAVQRGERAEQRLHPRQPARLLVGRAGRQPVVQELRVGVLRLHRLRQGAADLLRHLLLPGGPVLLEPLRIRPPGRRRQGPARGGREGLRVRRRDGDRPAGRGRRPHRRPATGSSPTGSR